MSDKVRTILKWILRTMVCLLFLIAGLPKLTGMTGILVRFEEWGYLPQFAYLVGFLEVGGGIAVMIPTLSRFGAITLLIVMAGATVTHILAAEWMRLPIVFGFALGVYGTLWIDQSNQTD